MCEWRHGMLLLSLSKCHNLVLVHGYSLVTLTMDDCEIIVLINCSCTCLVQVCSSAFWWRSNNLGSRRPSCWRPWIVPFSGSRNRACSNTVVACNNVRTAKIIYLCNWSTTRLILRHPRVALNHLRVVFVDLFARARIYKRTHART